MKYSIFFRDSTHILLTRDFISMMKEVPLYHDVYHFDTKDHVFEKADRFTERQKEKEAQAAKTEKAGKEQPDKKPKTKKHDMEL